jgi:hypothetical protein
MAFLSGTTGYVKFGSTSYAFDKWSIDIEAGTPSVTNFSSAYQALVTGVIKATINLSGPFNSTAMAVAAGSSYAIHLGMDTGVELTCTALIANLKMDNAVEDAPRISVTARSTGSFTASVA